MDRKRTIPSTRDGSPKLKYVEIINGKFPKTFYNYLLSTAAKSE